MEAHSEHVAFSRPRPARAKRVRAYGTPAYRRARRGDAALEHHEFFERCYELSELARRIARRIRPGSALYAALRDPQFALRAVLAVAFTCDAAADLTTSDLPSRSQDG